MLVQLLRTPAWSPSYFHSKQKKINAGSWTQRNRSQMLQSLEPYQFSAEVVQEKPAKTSHLYLFLCITLLH